MSERARHVLDAMERILNRTIVLFTGTLLFSLAIIIFIQVIFRYVLEDSLSWSEELTRYMMIWMTFLATGYVVGKRGHSNIDILTSQLSPQWRMRIDKANSVLLIVFSCMIVRYGIEFMSYGARQTSSALLIPMHYVYLAIPVGGVLMLFYAVVILLRQEGAPR